MRFVFLAYCCLSVDLVRADNLVELLWQLKGATELDGDVVLAVHVLKLASCGSRQVTL